MIRFSKWLQYGEMVSRCLAFLQVHMISVSMFYRTCRTYSRCDFCETTHHSYKLRLMYIRFVYIGIVFYYLVDHLYSLMAVALFPYKCQMFPPFTKMPNEYQSITKQHVWSRIIEHLKFDCLRNERGVYVTYQSYLPYHVEAL